MSRKWTEEYVQERFPAEVNEIRQSEGKKPNIKPLHSWLREHGFTGIQNYASRRNKTVDDVLLNECEFEPRERKPLPGTHAETKRLVRQWLEAEITDFSRLRTSSTGNEWTCMRKLIKICKEKLGSGNLIRPARAPPGKDVQLTIKIFRGLNEELESEGARYNYASSLDYFYDYLDLIGKADSNPARDLLPRMGWTYEREPPEMVLTPQQVRSCWEVTETLEEKILILCLAGCGLRTNGLLIIKACEDVHYDRADPIITLDDQRKNLQGTVPIMVGVGYFEKYIEQLATDDDWNGMLFPSELSEDGSRSDTWVREQIEDIVERAGVTFPDGTQPTPKHFRRFWYNEYIEAYQSYMAMVQDVANIQGSESGRVVNKHYLSTHHERDHFRRYAQTHFETAFPVDSVPSPEEIIDARDKDEDNDGQTTLGRFNSSTPAGVVGLCSATIGKISYERLRREYADLIVEDGSWAPPKRMAKGMTVSMFLLTVMSVQMASAGVYFDPTTMEAGTPLVPTLGILLGSILGTVQTLLIESKARAKDNLNERDFFDFL